MSQPQSISEPQSTSQPRDPISGRFLKGISGNPAGRPSGSRNNTTLAVEGMLEGEAEVIARKAIELAKKGDLQALRLCLDRILPPRRERSIQLELKPRANPQDLPLNHQEILSAVAEGTITPGEGQALSSIVTSHFQTLNIIDFEKRLQKIEASLSDVVQSLAGLDLCCGGESWTRHHSLDPGSGAAPSSTPPSEAISANLEVDAVTHAPEDWRDGGEQRFPQCSRNRNSGSGSASVPRPQETAANVAENAVTHAPKDRRTGVGQSLPRPSADRSRAGTSSVPNPQTTVADAPSHAPTAASQGWRAIDGQSFSDSSPDRTSSTGSSAVQQPRPTAIKDDPAACTRTPENHRDAPSIGGRQPLPQPSRDPSTSAPQLRSTAADQKPAIRYSLRENWRD